MHDGTPWSAERDPGSGPEGKTRPLDAAPAAGHPSEKAAAAGRRGGGYSGARGGTAHTGSRPAPDGAGGQASHPDRTAAEARNRGFTARSPSGIRRPTVKRIVPDGCSLPSRFPRGPAVPGGLSDSHEAQDGAGELAGGSTAAPWKSTAPSGPAAAATVETIAAADDKIRRAKTPGGVVKRAVAIDVLSLDRVHQWLGRAGELAFLCSTASRVRRYGDSERVAVGCQARC